MKLKKIKRNDNGLISGSSVDYVYNEDGFVDWRKMVKTDHLVQSFSHDIKLVRFIGQLYFSFQDGSFFDSSFSLWC